MIGIAVIVNDYIVSEKEQTIVCLKTTRRYQVVCQSGVVASSTHRARPFNLGVVIKY